MAHENAQLTAIVNEQKNTIAQLKKELQTANGRIESLMAEVESLKADIALSKPRVTNTNRGQSDTYRAGVSGSIIPQGPPR